MGTLKERLGASDKRQQVIDDACRVLDQEVDDKGGLGGMAVKAAYSVVKGVRPGFIRQAVDALLDDFLDVLDPFHREALEKGKRPSDHVRAEASRVAEALLGVTDKKAERADSGMIRKTYDKLRPSAKKHVEAAAPRMGQLLDKHAPDA
ncbi:MAG TPA: hypothetical protein VIV60_35595 [Polyangiaceae bacterium]